MAATGVQQSASAEQSAAPNYLTDQNAVLKDLDAKWRYGRPPDYSNTRAVFERTKQMTHAAGSLPELVQNLVKNWEIEASFKTDINEWRTVDPEKYSFSINGGPPLSGEDMLKLGTYNAIISPNDYYSPKNSDFASSHKTFKRMMPTFAWEVIEVYSGPPRVAFKWRHWGTMKNDYVGFNDKNEKVTAKAHGGSIDIQGLTVAQVDDKIRIQTLETWFDPMDMFRQIAPNGIVNKQPRKAHHPKPPQRPIDEPPSPKPISMPTATVDPEGQQAQEVIQTANESNTAQQELIRDGPCEEAVSYKPMESPTDSPESPLSDGLGLRLGVNVFNSVDVTQLDNDLPKSPIDENSIEQPASPKSIQTFNSDTTATEQLGRDADLQDLDGDLFDEFHDAVPEIIGNDDEFNEESLESLITDPIDNPLSEPSQIELPDSPELESTEVVQSTQPSDISLPITSPVPAASTSAEPIAAAVPTAPHPIAIGTSPASCPFASKYMATVTGTSSGENTEAEHSTDLQPGNAVTEPANSEATRLTHEEMSRIFPIECPFLMNRE
ncbi:MAG: hypothetical protein M1834_005203 [Cirrosporium novae-zelandiae]|nr:MAG: hypothetical protein M1834_005203 [Cirrosporium novae-zelandiae]